MPYPAPNYYGYYGQQPGYNPPAQDQLAQLRGMQYQMQPQPGQAMQTPYMNGQANTQGGFICCPVTSREEAVAYRVEAFGPSVIMPDFGHGMIYFKRFNEKTALADFAEFRYCPPQKDGSNAPEKPHDVDISTIFGDFSKCMDELSQKVDSIIEKLESKPMNRQARKAQVENE